jgi:hypothetical protein
MNSLDAGPHQNTQMTNPEEAKAQKKIFKKREARWLNGSVPDCCPAVSGSNPASPQPTADCQSPGGLPPGMALGCRLTSVRGNRGENYEIEPLVRHKNTKQKKKILLLIFCPAKTKQPLDQLPPHRWQIQWISKRWPPSQTVAQKHSVC